MCVRITDKTIWDKRTNLTNKPSLSFRSIEVIQSVMQEKEVALGVAIEMLFTTDGLYSETIEKLSEDYTDIKDN